MAAPAPALAPPVAAPAPALAPALAPIPNPVAVANAALDADVVAFLNANGGAPADPAVKAAVISDCEHLRDAIQSPSIKVYAVDLLNGLAADDWVATKTALDNLNNRNFSFFRRSAYLYYKRSNADAAYTLVPNAAALFDGRFMPVPVATAADEAALGPFNQAVVVQARDMQAYTFILENLNYILQHVLMDINQDICCALRVAILHASQRNWRRAMDLLTDIRSKSKPLNVVAERELLAVLALREANDAALAAAPAIPVAVPVVPVAAA
jgi:hypothetical protein